MKAMDSKYRELFYNKYLSEKVRKDGSAISFSEINKWIKAAIIRLKPWLPPNRNARILDLGCGFGNFLYLLNKLGYKNIEGVDISTEQIDMAKKILPELNIIHLNLTEYLRSNEISYDLITLFDVIEHFNKNEVIEILDLVYNKLNPGGSVIIQTPNAESPWFGSVAFGDFTHEWFYTPEGLHDILIKTRFRKFEAKPSQPAIYGIKSFLRFCIWKIINIFLKIWNLSETGTTGSGIYTRVFLARSFK